MKIGGVPLRMSSFVPASATIARARARLRGGAGGRLLKFTRLVSAAGCSVGLKIGSAAMTFLTTILVARSLTATGVGVYALVGISSTIGAIIVSAGFDALALKLGARRSPRHTERRLWRILTIFALVLPLSGAIAAVLIAALLAIYGFDWKAMLAPVAVQTIALGVYRVVATSVQARGGIVLSQIGELLVRPAAVLAMTFLAEESSRLDVALLVWIMAAGAAACLLYAILVFLVLAGRGACARLRFPPRRLIAGLVARAPSYAGFFAVVLLIEQIDILLLGVLRGEGEAGLYQPASRIAWLASLGGVAISIIGRPEIAKAAAQKNPARIARLMTVYRAASVLYFSASALFLILFSEAIFRLFGREYENASAIVFVLLVLHGVAALIGPVDSAAQVLGSGESILARSLVALGAFLVAGLALIPPLGAQGAAFAAVIGGVLYRAAFLIFVRKRLSEFRSPAAAPGAAINGGA